MSPQLFFADLSAGFDAPQLLPWLAAGGLPLLLAWQVHRRLPRVAFGGFQLLREAARATAGWPVSASWLIVALRMVLLAAAALAAAGPYVVSRSAGAGFLQQDFEKQGRVLVVAEQPTETAAANEPTSRAVLAAFAAAGNGLRPIAAEPVATLAEALAAGRSRHVLVICDGLVPSPQEATDWWQWIEAGGAGLVLLGPETLRDRGWPTWQQSLTSRTGLTFAGVVETGGSQLAAGAGLPDRRSAGKPLVGGLTAVPGPTIERLVGLGLPHQLDEFATLAVTGNQQLPTAVCRPLGRGAITVSALPLSLRAARPPPADPAAGRWSDLTAWPVFLPYFRGLVGETVAGCRTAGSGLNARWSIPRLPSLLLLVALLALGAEAALTTARARRSRWLPWPGRSRGRPRRWMEDRLRKHRHQTAQPASLWRRNCRHSAGRGKRLKFRSRSVAGSPPRRGWPLTAPREDWLRCRWHPRWAPWLLPTPKKPSGCSGRFPGVLRLGRAGCSCGAFHQPARLPMLPASRPGCLRPAQELPIVQPGCCWSMPNRGSSIALPGRPWRVILGLRSPPDRLPPTSRSRPSTGPTMMSSGWATVWGHRWSQRDSHCPECRRLRLNRLGSSWPLDGWRSPGSPASGSAALALPSAGRRNGCRSGPTARSLHRCGRAVDCR